MTRPGQIGHAQGGREQEGSGEALRGYLVNPPNLRGISRCGKSVAPPSATATRKLKALSSYVGVA